MNYISIPKLQRAIPYFIMDVITYPCWEVKINVSKRGRGKLCKVTLSSNWVPMVPDFQISSFDETEWADTCAVVCIDHLGVDSVKKCRLISMGNSIMEIRRSYDRLISTMGFPILVRPHIYIESGPRAKSRQQENEEAADTGECRLHLQHIIVTS